MIKIMRGTFAVLNEFEKKLPANLFDSEYKYNKNKGIKSFLVCESKLPLAFMILEIIFILVGIIFVISYLFNIPVFNV